MAESLLHLHDVCADFSYKAERHKAPAVCLAKTIRAALDKPNDSLELDDVCEALTAAELVAAARGWPDAEMRAKLQAKLQKKLDGQTDELVELARQCVAKMATGGHELADGAGSWESVQSAIGELAARLAQAPRQLPPPPKHPRPRPGDVYRISVGSGKVAYWRMSRDGFLFVYRGIFPEDSAPPIGSRDFLFYSLAHILLSDEIGSPKCVLVGKDPVAADEQRPLLVANENWVPVTVWGKVPGLTGGLYLQPWQCLGVEGMGHNSLESLRERIIKPESSLQRSMADFAGKMTAKEQERGLAILGNKVCRLFTDAEHRAFGIIPG